MDDSKKLLISPPPFFDESLEGYIVRLATCNQYESVSWIYKYAHLLSNRRKEISRIVNLSPQDYDLLYLSHLTGVLESELWKLTYYNQFGHLSRFDKENYINKFLHSFALRGWKIRVCPSCLEERNYIRKIWSLSIYNICHLHSSVLISNCTRCGGEIKISNIPVGSCCECGGNLSLCEVIKVPPSESNVEHFLYSKLYSHEGLKKYTNNYLVNLDFKLVVFLIMFFAQKIDNVPGIKKIIISTQAAFEIFSDWKRNFFNFLDDYIKQPKGRDYTGVRRDFGSLDNVILKEFKNAFPEHLEFIIKAFEEFVTEKWEGGYLPNHYVKKFSLERKWLSKDDVVEILKMSPYTLDRLIEIGIIPARVLYKVERKLVLIHIDNVNEYIKQSKKELTVQETKEILDITDQSILKLINAGILKGLNRFSNNKTWSINTDSVLKVLETFESKVRINDKRFKLISFQQCLRIVTGEHKDICEFLNAVNSGKIKLIFTKDNKKGLNKFYFQEDEVRKVMGEENIYSLSQISRNLEVDKIVVSFWVKNGFLRAEASKKQFRITKDNFNQFKNTYITMKEICKGVDLRPLTVLAYLKRNNIKAISGKKIDGGKMYLFLRMEIEPITFTD